MTKEQEKLVLLAQSLNIKPFHVSKTDSRCAVFWNNFFRMETSSAPAEQYLRQFLTDKINNIFKLMSDLNISLP